MNLRKKYSTCFISRVLILILPSSSFSVSSAVDEVPHAAELSDILSKTVFKNSSSNVDTFFGRTGNESSNTFDFSSFSDNLELRKLDLETLRKIIAMAAKKDNGFRRALNDRKSWQYEDSNPVYYASNWPKTKPGTDIVAKLLNLMKQSIYFVRDRVQVTKPYRLKLDRDVRYRIGVLLGTVHELMLKLDNVYATLRHLNLEEVNFIYFLMVYERFLTVHTDITYTVENVFKLHRRWALRVTTQKEVLTTYKYEFPENCTIPDGFESLWDDEQVKRYHLYLEDYPEICKNATANKDSYNSGKQKFNKLNPLIPPVPKTTS